MAGIAATQSKVVLASLGALASVALTLSVAACGRDNPPHERTSDDIVASPPPNATGDETVATTTSETPTTSGTPATTDIGGTTEWRAPDDSFTIGALPTGFTTRGSPQIVEAAFSPTGDSLVSQTFVDLGQNALLTVSLETGPYAAQQLVPGDMTLRMDILDGTNVYVSTDANSQPLAVAWQPTNDSVVWFYGTNMFDETMFDIVRSIKLSTT